MFVHGAGMRDPAGRQAGFAREGASQMQTASDHAQAHVTTYDASGALLDAAALRAPEECIERRALAVRAATLLVNGALGRLTAVALAVVFTAPLATAAAAATFSG